jgi:flagellar biosynthesis protein FliQ
MMGSSGVEIIGDALFTIIALVSVAIIPGLLVGLVVSIIQAATQVQEQTLSFFPRLIITLLAIAFTGQWMLQQIMDLFGYLFLNIPSLLGNPP